MFTPTATHAPLRRALLAALAAALSLDLFAPSVQAQIIYVDQNAGRGLSDGSSWPDAFPDLQGALASGLYFVRLTGRDFVGTETVTLVR